MKHPPHVNNDLFGSVSRRGLQQILATD